jgi:hypothetical protein
LVEFAEEREITKNLGIETSDGSYLSYQPQASNVSMKTFPRSAFVYSKTLTMGSTVEGTDRKNHCSLTLWLNIRGRSNHCGRELFDPLAWPQDADQNPDAHRKVSWLDMAVLIESGT